MTTASFILVGIMARQRRILRKFEQAGASEAARARTQAELGIGDSHLFGRLVKAGVLVGASEGRYYLDAEGLARWHHRRRIGVLVAVGIVVVGVLIALAVVASGR